MAEKLEYIISAVDQSKSAADSAKKNLQGIGAAAQQAGKQTVQAGQQAQQSLKQVEVQSRRTGDALKAVQSAVQVAAFAKFAKDALSASSQMDSLKRGLAAVAGSAAAAEVQLARLRQVAKLPGLNLEQAVKGSIALQSVGLSANLAERSLKAFGNALVSSGKGAAELEGINLALTQIVGKGKVSAEEINQIAERFPGIRKAMMDAFGTADTEAIQKMGLSAEEFIGRIVTQLEKIPKAAGGAANSFENLNDAAQQALVAIGDAVLPAAAALAEKLVPIIEGAARQFKELPDVAKQAFLGVVAAAAVLTPVLTVIGQIRNGLAALGVGAGTVGGAAALGAGATAAVAASGPGSFMGPTTAAARMTAAAPAAAGTGFAAAVGGISAIPVVGAGLAAGAYLQSLDFQRAQADAAAENTDKATAELQAGDPRLAKLAMLKRRRNTIAGLVGKNPRAKAALAAIDAEIATVRSSPKPGSPEASMATSGLFPGQLDAEEEQARAMAGGDAQDEAKRVVPIIRRQQAELVRQAKELLPRVKTSAEAAKQYYALSKEYWQREREVKQLEDAATKELEQTQKKAAADEKKRVKEAADAAKAAVEAQRGAVEARIAVLPEEKQAQAKVDTLIPFLAKQAQEALDKMKQSKAGSKEYWDAEQAYWQTIEEAGKLRNDLEEEKARKAKKTAEDAKKAREKALKTAQDSVKNTQGAADAAADLAKAQLETLSGIDPQAADEFKRKSLIPSLLGKIQSLGLAVPGETPEDAVRRQIQAEEAKREILGAAGFGKENMRFGNLLGGGSIPLFDQAGAMGLVGQLNEFQRGGRNSLQVGQVNIMPTQQTEAAFREAWLQAFDFYVKPALGGLAGI